MIRELWADPRDGLDPDLAAWNWREIDREDGGEAEFPPGWRRVYILYETPRGRVRVSVNVRPDGKRYFHPHLSSRQPDERSG